MKKTVLFAAIAALYTLVSCQPIQTYVNSYSYIVSYDEYGSYDIHEDASTIFNELCNAVGCQPKVYSSPSTVPQDDAKKAACSNVVKKNEELGKKSVYMRFWLIRQFTKMESHTFVEDTIAVYEMGDAMFTPYAFYKYTSNYDEAYKAFQEKMKDQRGTELYKECGQSYMAVKEAFKKFMDTKDANTGAAAITSRPWRDNDATINFIKEGCDIIYDNNSDGKFPEPLTYTVYKRPFPAGGDITPLWSKTFEGNVE
ncbi:MAG: hypothetical protein IK052_06050 [Bacteroidales bacterium]|nr:hypothetical protein [Bacteroidales bacterium]